MIEINRWIDKKVKKVMNITFLITFTYFCFNTAALAQDAVNVEIKAPTPTLDTLKGQPIPDTDPIRYYPESAYTLTKVDAKGDNTITVYEWDNTQNKLMPVYYQVSLKQTEYGEGDGVKYFKWKKTDDGIKLIETQNQSEAQITVKYDTTQSHTRFENSTDNSSTNINGGSFVNQTTGSTSGSQHGGSINNNGSDAKLGDINADFVGNYAQANSSGYSAIGGAIYNSYGTIGNITGDFIGNYVQGSSGAYGGAIYNYSGRIGDITGDFIGNYVKGSSYTYGGAIYNHGTIGDITGDFIGNYVQGSSGAFGGAIYNFYRTIGDITGDFIGNYVQAERSAEGGAIYNHGTIGDITGDFIGNYAQANSSGYSAYGGAIYNYNGGAIIESITGNFIGNYAKGSSSASGGAIYNYGGTITLKDSSFINNGVISPENANGGAIYINYDTVNIIAENKDVVFDGNYSATAKNPDGTLENKKPDGIYMTNGVLNLSPNSKKHHHK